MKFSQWGFAHCVDRSSGIITEARAGGLLLSEGSIWPTPLYRYCHDARDDIDFISICSTVPFALSEMLTAYCSAISSAASIEKVKVVTKRLAAVAMMKSAQRRDARARMEKTTCPIRWTQLTPVSLQEPVSCVSSVAFLTPSMVPAFTSIRSNEPRGASPRITLTSTGLS